MAQPLDQTTQPRCLDQCYQSTLCQIDKAFEKILDDEDFPHAIVEKTFTWLENLSDFLTTWAVDVEVGKSSLPKLNDTVVGQPLRKLFGTIEEELRDSKNLLVAFESATGVSDPSGDTETALTISLGCAADVASVSEALVQLQHLVNPIRDILASKHSTGPDSLLRAEIDKVFLHYQSQQSSENQRQRALPASDLVHRMNAAPGQKVVPRELPSSRDLSTAAPPGHLSAIVSPPSIAQQHRTEEHNSEGRTLQFREPDDITSRRDAPTRRAVQRTQPPLPPHLRSTGVQLRRSLYDTVVRSELRGDDSDLGEELRTYAYQYRNRARPIGNIYGSLHVMENARAIRGNAPEESYPTLRRHVYGNLNIADQELLMEGDVTDETIPDFLLGGNLSSFRRNQQPSAQQDQNISPTEGQPDLPENPEVDQ
ncbi:hypothetical protein H2198_010722 [Neophaeococcomyces mojaviensis]|uniref:Uncharacterized protein n=1 Tax=Neophaeococcomyces mojaviensis TaxID=3383035 RepID=A0ACC2ZQR9_9EURO|nr:hypothetical protein H2198_010722 [Knufia sp. JES_112]